MDIYCLGGKTWLICGPKEAKTIQYTLLGAAQRPPKGYIAKFGFLWAANQPGFSPQAVNIHHPTELLCFKFWLGMQPTILPYPNLKVKDEEHQCTQCTYPRQGEVSTCTENWCCNECYTLGPKTILKCQGQSRKTPMYTTYISASKGSSNLHWNLVLQWLLLT